jgi:hypothetical protein
MRILLASLRPAGPVLILPALHLMLCVYFEVTIGEASGSWKWFLMLFVDFPISLLLLRIPLPGLFVYGFLGTLWWYLICALIRYIFLRYEESLKPE